MGLIIEQMQGVAALWGKRCQRMHLDLILPGSPERTLSRIVIEDDHGDLFSFEEIDSKVLSRKSGIIQILKSLNDRSMLFIEPYCCGLDGQCVQELDGHFWQMVRFVPGVDLDRSTYLYEGWRAKDLTAFLISLKEKSYGLPLFDKSSFSMVSYIEKLIRDIKKYRPELMGDIELILRFLNQEFLGQSESLPLGFCHGDYHPLNVIWSESGVRIVIDWEFCGIKSEIYDAVNMIGCLGMEHPSSLTADLAIDFISGLQKAGIYQQESWKYFLEFIVAQRFGWLAEWLRKNDEEMISLELDYMKLLIDNRSDFLKAWRISYNW